MSANTIFDDAKQLLLSASLRVVVVLSDLNVSTSLTTADVWPRINNPNPLEINSHQLSLGAEGKKTQGSSNPWLRLRPSISSTI